MMSIRLHKMNEFSVCDWRYKAESSCFINWQGYLASFIYISFYPIIDYIVGN